MGLGMGWAAANAALHPAVSQVTVVRIRPGSDCCRQPVGILTNYPNLPVRGCGWCGGDAYQYVPDTPADTLLADIWLPLFGAERDAAAACAPIPALAECILGQEMVIAHRARQRTGHQRRHGG